MKISFFFFSIFMSRFGPYLCQNLRHNPSEKTNVFRSVHILLACFRMMLVFLRITSETYEPRHDTTNNVAVRPAKTQISLGIRPVWSESSLSAWKNLWSLATHWVHSEDSDQTGRMPRLIWVFAWRTLIMLVLSCRGSYCFSGTRSITRKVQHVCRTHSLVPVCSGHTVPRDTGVVRGETLHDSLVPGLWWASTTRWLTGSFL